MKFVTLGGRHINMEHVSAFMWYKGVLHLSFVGEEDEGELADPNMAHYKKLCAAAGVEPVGLSDEEA